MSERRETVATGCTERSGMGDIVWVELVSLHGSRGVCDQESWRVIVHDLSEETGGGVTYRYYGVRFF